MAELATTVKDMNKINMYFTARENNPTSGTTEEVSSTPKAFKAKAIATGDFNGKVSVKIKGVNALGKNVNVSLSPDADKDTVLSIPIDSEQYYEVKKAVQEGGRNWRCILL